MREHFIPCPYCSDERNSRSERKWWDYFFSTPWVLLRYVPRRCEHCYRRFWVSTARLRRWKEVQRERGWTDYS
jgi:hypothetical protein